MGRSTTCRSKVNHIFCTGKFIVTMAIKRYSLFSKEMRVLRVFQCAVLSRQITVSIELC